MAILEHLVPDAGEHLTKWRETLVEHATGIERRLDSIREAIQDRQTTPTEMTRHITGEGASGAGTDVQLRLDVPPGYDWTLTLMAVVGGAGGGVALYLGTINPASLLFVIPDGQFTSEILPDIPIPSGANLMVHFYNQPAATTCTVRIIAKSDDAGMGAGT